MKVTFYGHSSFQIDTGTHSLIFDPFISQNEQAANIDLHSLKADFVLLSHGHGDHVADAEAILNNNQATLISNFEIVTYYGKKGINGHPMNHGGKWKFDFGTVNYVNAVHSSVLPDGTYAGNAGGFVITAGDKTFYFAGDTALTLDMKLIPILYPKLDFAILPIGDNFTMGYAQAAIAAEYIECDNIIGCHFDTFGYIKVDHEAAKEAFRKHGKDLTLLGIGESVEY